MNWVKEFYTCQNDWFGVYLGEIEDSHKERADLINEMNGKDSKRILELGAGGGQTALSLAKLGHNVTMVELLSASVEHAKNLSEKSGIDLKVIQGDFYQVEFAEQFDLICYFDSFGIGSDKDQRRLLKRINNWLKPNGSALIEIGSTWYWGGIARDRTMDLGACIRKYEFDAKKSRLIDTWWRKEAPEKKVYQSLRCYTPADIELLLEGTGLRVEMIEPGGKIDYEAMKFVKKVPIEEAMTYYIKLVLK